MAGTIRTKALALGGGALAGVVLLGGVAFAQVPGTPTPAAPAPTQQAGPSATPVPGTPGTPGAKEDCPEGAARGAGAGTTTPGTSGFSRSRAPQA